MSERYSRLYSLPENLYVEGSPVLVLAGALLKDNQTGKLLVQLKLRNISQKQIKSVKIKVNAYDTAGDPLKGVAEFSYLDMAVAANEDFGQSTPIALLDASTRSFGVEILQAVYADKEVFTPAASNETQAAPQAVIDAVRQTDDEIAARAEQAAREEYEQKASRKRKQMAFLFPILAIAFAVGTLVINCFRTSPYAFDGAMQSYILNILGYLIIMIAPCLLLISGYAPKKQPVLRKVTTIIVIVSSVLQITVMIVYTIWAANRYPQMPVFVYRMFQIVPGDAIIDRISSISRYIAAGVTIEYLIIPLLLEMASLAPNVLTGIALFKLRRKKRK